MIQEFIQIPHVIRGVLWDGTNTEEIRNFIGQASWFLPGVKHLEATFWDNKISQWLDLPKYFWLLRKRNGELFKMSANDIVENYVEVQQ